MNDWSPPPCPWAPRAPLRQLSQVWVAVGPEAVSPEQQALFDMMISPADARRLRCKPAPERAILGTYRDGRWERPSSTGTPLTLITVD